MSGHRNFNELKARLDARLDALPGGRGNEIRYRLQRELEQLLKGVAHERIGTELRAQVDDEKRRG